MRAIKSLLMVTLLLVFAFADDAKENLQVLRSLYEKVIMKDVNNTLGTLDILKKSIKEKNVTKVKKEFSKLVISWKSVETFYILGDLDEDYIDIPRYIDIFHNGNEDITKQLDRAIKTRDSLKIALFKNSFKSINALEYILFAKNIKKERINSIAIAIVNTIKMHVADIKKGYITNKKNFLNDYKNNYQKANSILINAIVQSTYKLKEWRIGDTMGLTKKYKGKLDNRRAEYFLSKNSVNAIIGILKTYKNIFNNKSFEDYGDYLIKLTHGGEVKSLRKNINKALELTKTIKNDNLVFAKKLYQAVSKIHVILFLDIINELSVNAKILEADGD